MEGSSEEAEISDSYRSGTVQAMRDPGFRFHIDSLIDARRTEVPIPKQHQ